MNSRRKFLWKSLLASTGLSGLQLFKAYGGNAAPAIKGQAIVVSTWNHGLPANEAAWKVLQAGGRALEWLKTSQYKPLINVENHDTISMLALDKNGNLSGACTTSGAAWKMHGRVGDSPIIGAGLFVDNEVGGACATGLGEAVIKMVGSHLVVELMRQGRTPQQACEAAVDRIVSRQKNYKDLQVGFLALNKAGEAGAYAIHGGFNYAVHNGQQNVLIDAKSFVK